jgi:hypothetical protein
MLLLSEATHAAEEEASTIVVVGKLVSIEELPDPCEKAKDSAELTCISLDALYRATYQVVRVLRGPPELEEISFGVADHYGFPDFAEYQHALLFVNGTPSSMWLEKYQGFAVHPTTDGSWAACGNPYDERAGDPPRGLRRLEFATDLGIVGEFSTEGIERRFPSGKYLSVSDGRIRCNTGVAIEDLYELVRNGVLAARGVKLPPLEAKRGDL